MGFSQLPRQLDIMNACGIRASTATTTPISAATPTTRHRRRHAPLRFGLFRPALAGRRDELDQRDHRTALYSNYALSLSGTSDKSSYYASFSYNDTPKVSSRTAASSVFTGRINLERQLFKWLKVGYTGSYTWRHNDQNKSSIGGTAWYSSAQYCHRCSSRPTRITRCITTDRRSTRRVR